MKLAIFLPRSGSTTFCQDLSAKLGYHNLEEFLHNGCFTVEHRRSFYEQMLAKGHTVGKVCEYQVEAFKNDTGIDPMPELIEAADEVYFLYRRDFNAVCKSFYAASQHNDWWPDSKPNREVKYDKHMWRKLVEGLIKQAVFLKTMLDITPKNKAILIALEDWQSTDKKYNKSYTWEIEPPHVEFNISALLEK